LFTLLKGLIAVLILLAFLVSALFIDFVYKTFSYRAIDYTVDAIVVLAGGRGRVEEGVKLFKSGKGEHLFLIGVDPVVKKADLYTEKSGERSGEEVYLEKASRNTLENAIFAREMMQKNNVRSMLLITSRYHMKRSLLIFRSILPKDIAIYPHPVAIKNSAEQWWSHGGSLRLLFSEFYKYCLYRVIFIFSQGELR
jgi:uncharacterized SAM-binding protein YcdF (DUF218 family)